MTLKKKRENSNAFFGGSEKATFAFVTQREFAQDLKREEKRGLKFGTA